MGDEEDSTRDDDNQFMRADPNEQYENEHDNGQEEVNTPEPNQDGNDAQTIKLILHLMTYRLQIKLLLKKQYLQINFKTEHSSKRAPGTLKNELKML